MRTLTLALTLTLSAPLLTSCKSSVGEVSRASDNISVLLSRATDSLDKTTTLLGPVGTDAPPAGDLDSARQNVAAAHQSLRDLTLENRKIALAIPGLEDRTPAWMRLLFACLYVAGVLATVFALWYLGIGALIGRLVGLVASLIPQIIPRHIESQAKLDAESLLQTRAAAKNGSPESVAAADTLSSNIAIRRTRSPLYEAAFRRYHSEKP